LIRAKLQSEMRMRVLALFNLATDCKLRAAMSWRCAPTTWLPQRLRDRPR